MDSLLCLDIKPFNHTRISKEIHQMIGKRKVTDSDTLILILKYLRDMEEWFQDLTSLKNKCLYMFV